VPGLKSGDAPSLIFLDDVVQPPPLDHRKLANAAKLCVQGFRDAGANRGELFFTADVFEIKNSHILDLLGRSRGRYTEARNQKTEDTKNSFHLK
jgi:hypothetical protein